MKEHAKYTEPLLLILVCSGDGNFEFDEDMLIEEDDQNEQLRYEILENEDLDISESISGNNHSNSFSLCQDNFSSFFDAKEANASSSSVLANKEEFNPDLPVKYLIKKFCVKDNSKSFSDLHRQDFLANYGFNIRPGQSSPHIRTLLQTNENLTTVLYKDRIFQLVNIQTNVGPRTLLLPIAQLPSKVRAYQFFVKDTCEDILLFSGRMCNFKLLSVIYPFFSETFVESRNKIYDFAWNVKLLY